MAENTAEAGSASTARVLTVPSAPAEPTVSVASADSSTVRSDSSSSRGRSISRQSSGSLPILQQRKMEDLERRRSQSPSGSFSSEFELEVVSTNLMTSLSPLGPAPARGRPPLSRQKGLLSSPGGTPLGSSLPDAPDEAAEIARAVAESRQRAAARVREHYVIIMPS